MVHIYREERNKIMYGLLMDGVLCVKKEFFGTHEDSGVDNLKVWVLMRSLHSKGYLDVIFSWRHYYYTLNNNGIEYIKSKLGLTNEEIQPVTRKIRKEFVDNEKQLAEEAERPQRGERGIRGRGRKDFGARGGERRFNKEATTEKYETKPQAPESEI